MAPELFRTDKNSQFSPFSKKSDIYSLGVLLWELSSGYPPFKNYEKSEMLLQIEIINYGKREQKISNTPPDYYKLYSDCWDEKPEKRPNIEDVYHKLKNMLPDNNKDTEGNLILNFYNFYDFFF
jgi:serine/threonine protein kinase